MALIFCDGFDHYAVANMAKKWSTVSATGSVYIMAGGRVGGLGSYLYITSASNRMFTKNTANIQTYIVGFGVKHPLTGVAVFQALDGTTTQQQLVINANGSVTIAGQTSAAGVIPSSAWTYIEIKCKTDNTTGTIEVRINGSSTPVISATGLNTQASANAYCNAFRISTNGATMSLDDFYLCDNSGSVNNDFLGDVYIEAIYPNAEGSNSGFTLSTGTTHYAVLDETTPNDDTDYAYSSTLNARETVNMGNVSSVGGTVHGVAVNAWVRKVGTETRGVKPVIKSGSTYSLGSELTLATEYIYVNAIYETNPDTFTAWTETTVNAIEAGVDVST